MRVAAYVTTMWVLVWIAVAIGWVLNIIKLMDLLHAANPDLVWVIVRVAGIPIFVLGALLGIVT